MPTTPQPRGGANIRKSTKLDPLARVFGRVDQGYVSQVLRFEMIRITNTPLLVPGHLGGSV